MTTTTVSLAKSVHASRHAAGGADVLTPAAIGAAAAADGVTAAERSKLAAQSGTNTGDQTSVTGNAGTATKLAVARTINGVAFDGTANITVTAAATNTLWCLKTGGDYTNRPASTFPVQFKGDTPPATGGTTAGGTPAAVAGLDVWFKTA